MNAIIILYVSDQSRARDFYRATLLLEPILDVPGMTEFPLATGAQLGLMPLPAISRLLGDKVIQPERRSVGDIPPQCEIYLTVEDPSAFHARAIAAGAHEILPVEPRNWGDEAGYLLDLDGHVLAFARAVE